MTFKLSSKMPAMIVGAAMFVGLGIGLVSYFTAKNSLEVLADQRLESSASLMAGKVKNYLEDIRNDLMLTASNPFAVKAVQEFSGAWDVWSILGGNPEELL
ncbi:MAG: methyl-accepting chemotaxis protein, partial [Hyphomicrobiales bacterium]